MGEQIIKYAINNLGTEFAHKLENLGADKLFRGM